MRLNKPMFFTCVAFVLMILGIATIFFACPVFTLGSYTCAYELNGDSYIEQTYKFDNHYLLITSSSYEQISNNNQLKSYTRCKVPYKILNKSLTLDIENLVILEEKTYNNIHNEHPDLISKLDVLTGTVPSFLETTSVELVNGIYFKLHISSINGATAYCLNGTSIVIFEFISIIGAIFYIKMCFAIRDASYSKKHKLDTRYDAESGKPYEVCVYYTNSSGRVIYKKFARNKNKLTYGLYAVFLGTFGAQYFYSGKIAKGIVSAVLSWTGVPTIIGFMTGIFAMCSTDYTFKEKYIAYKTIY